MMFLQPELDLDPRESLATARFEQNPGCNSFKKYLLKINWKKEIQNTQSVQSRQLEKSELKILDRFLNSVEPDILHRMRRVYGDFHRFKHRCKIWSCMNIEESAYKTACHEVGHVVSYWFTDGPKRIKCATIILEKGFSGRVHFEDLDRNYSCTNSDFFCDMCCYMGGALAEQMLAHSSKFNLNGMKHDLVILALLSYILAKNTMEEAGETDPMELMSFFFRKCYEVTYNILKENQRYLKGLSYALFAEKKLDYWDIFEIIGPRPQMDKTLYDKFIKDEISSGQFKKVNEYRSKIFIDSQRSRRERFRVETISSKTDSSESIYNLSYLFTEENESFFVGDWQIWISNAKK